VKKETCCSPCRGVHTSYRLRGKGPSEASGARRDNHVPRGTSPVFHFSYGTTRLSETRSSKPTTRVRGPRNGLEEGFSFRGCLSPLSCKPSDPRRAGLSSDAASRNVRFPPAKSPTFAETQGSCEPGFLGCSLGPLPWWEVLRLHDHRVGRLVGRLVSRLVGRRVARPRRVRMYLPPFARRERGFPFDRRRYAPVSCVGIWSEPDPDQPASRPTSFRFLIPEPILVLVSSAGRAGCEAPGESLSIIYIHVGRIHVDLGRGWSTPADPRGWPLIVCEG
jgi:hypothetical protein